MTISLLDHARSLINKLEYEAALQFITRIPEDERDIDMHLECLLECGQTEEAATLLRNIPDKTSKQHMALAQLETGKQAVEEYQKGIQKTQDINEITDANCAIAEIWLTDLCFEEDAETQIENALQAALNSKPNYPQALCLLASTRLSQSKPEEAIKLLQSIDKSSAETRIPAAKLYMELSDWDSAMDLLEDALEEEESVEALYLFALCYNETEQQESGKEALEIALKLAERTQFEDADMISHMKELLQNYEAPAYVEMAS